MNNKYIAYYRVSTAKSGGLDSYGIQSQKDTVSRYISSVGGELVQAFEEVMGGSKCSNRPQLLAALALASTLNAIVCCAKLDRLSRDLFSLLQIQRSGVRLVFCDFPQADSFHLNLVAMMAQRERELISSRTKAGLAIARASGVTLGAPLEKLANARIIARQSVQERKERQYGAALKAIREIQSTNVESKAKISNYLTLRGIPTVSGKGKWTTSMVCKVLKASLLFGSQPLAIEA